MAQPRCDALATMSTPPVWRTVFSVPNLDSFQNFLAFYASTGEVQELLQLPVVYHRSSVDGLVLRIDIGVVINGNWTALPARDCASDSCDRCRTGRGGYAFCWVDPRWTPEAALDLTQTPLEMRHESSEPWPRGILGAPQPARGPSPFLTSMWEFPHEPH